MPPPTKDQLQAGHGLGLVLNFTDEQFANAPWMRFVQGELGTAEERGAANSTRVLWYLSHCKGSRKMLQADATPWCSAFACATMHAVGIESTTSLAARSWLRYGDAIEKRDVRFGDLVVYWRGAPVPASVVNAPGHVGFVTGIVGEQVLTAGGNQGDRVSVQPYPMRRVLAFRRPAVADLVLYGLLRKGV